MDVTSPVAKDFVNISSQITKHPRKQNKMDQLAFRYPSQGNASKRYKRSDEAV